MILKRVFSLVTAAFMLHLMLASGDLACAAHESHAGAVPSQPATLAHDGMPSHEEVLDQEDCDIPVRPDCCLAQASCSFSLALDGIVTEFAQTIEHSSVAMNPADFPVSPSHSPDPPPPKA